MDLVLVVGMLCVEWWGISMSQIDDRWDDGFGRYLSIHNSFLSSVYIQNASIPVPVSAHSQIANTDHTRLFSCIVSRVLRR